MAMPSAAKSVKPDGLFSSPEKLTLVVSLALAAVTLLLYNAVTHNGFVNFDDNRYITENSHVRSGLTWDTVTWAFRTTEQANWHPLTWLSHALDCQIFHLNPAGHHYMNVLLHVLNVLLVFFLLQKATACRWRSLMVAALFSVHPINVESVAWVSERKNLLCTLFFLLALGAYGWYVRKPEVKRYLVVALLFALGLMSKPMVITLPFVLLLLDYWPLQRMKSSSFSRLAVEKIPLLALSAASAIVTMIAQKSGGALRSAIDYPFAARLENAVVAYAGYVWKAIWPSCLAALYPHPGVSLPFWQVLVSAIFLITVTGAVIKLKAKPYLAVSWFWFLGTLVPVIGLIQVGGQATADRYAYIPFLGLFVMVVWGIADWAGPEKKVFAAIAGAVAVAALATVAYVQIGYWHDSISLWAHALQVTDRNYVAHDNMGNALAAQGEYAEALVHFQAAEAITPRDPVSQLNLGAYEGQQGKMTQAIQRFQSVLELTSDSELQMNALENLGAAYRKMHDFERARANYEAALRLQPDNAFALTGLGLVMQKTGNLNQAIQDYAHAVQIQASDTGFLLLAQACEKAGLTKEAGAAYGQAQQLSADLTRAQQRVNQQLSE